MTLIGRPGLVPGAVPSADLLGGEYPIRIRLEVVGLAIADVQFGETRHRGSGYGALERACTASSADGVLGTARTSGEGSRAT